LRFTIFRPFITNEFAKKAKSKDMAHSAGFGMANVAGAKSDQ
jgi:hypothetical protein